MAVFRVQKTQNYTIMSNHHLRNKALSLKAKGLLSLMLSLPEDWDYTTRGLASICKEGVDSVCATVRELEAAGYIIRRRIRDRNGQMRGMEYTVLEQPQPPEQDEPNCAQPKQAEPKREKPVQENYFLRHFVQPARRGYRCICGDGSVDVCWRVGVQPAGAGRSN